MSPTSSIQSSKSQGRKKEVKELRDAMTNRQWSGSEFVTKKLGYRYKKQTLYVLRAIERRILIEEIEKVELRKLGLLRESTHNDCAQYGRICRVGKLRG